MTDPSVTIWATITPDPYAAHDEKCDNRDRVIRFLCQSTAPRGIRQETAYELMAASVAAQAALEGLGRITIPRPAPAFASSDHAAWIQSSEWVPAQRRPSGSSDE